MEYVVIYTINDREYSFIGKHRPDLEKLNWHYYEDEEGALYHFRKEHMVSVYSSQIKKEK